MENSRYVRNILRAECGRPFDFLGRHEEDGRTVVRAFLPEAAEAWVICQRKGRVASQDTELALHEEVFSMQKIHKNGIYEVDIDYPKFKSYRIRILSREGAEREFYDPYCFDPLLTDYDLHLIGEGTHYKNYEKLGSHVRTVNGIKGVHFGVWAPNARSVSVAGDFNGWDERRHPMRTLGSSGIWEIFIPGLDEGTVYKYSVRSKHNRYRELKSDPFSFFFEVRPKSATIVYDIENRHEWKDGEWMSARQRRNWFQSPISIYELHPGSWQKNEAGGFLTYDELREKLIPYVKELGFTHIELLPMTEHPFDASWGYQTLGYFAPTSRFGRPDAFMKFVDACHQAGIGVIMDWVPAHFPKDAHGLGFFDGTCLYEHADPRQGEHKDWGTLIFNYARNEVRNYLISNALFWLDRYHVDGLRVDAVASMLYLDYSREPGQWIPNQYGGNENLEAIGFLKKFNEVVHLYHPGVLTMAEESTAWTGVSKPTYLGGLGFDMKWNMGWMHDTLEYFSKDPVHRKFHHNYLTFSMLYAFTENFVLPFSHDEVVYGKRSLLNRMPGDMWQKFANLRALYGYMFGHPGKKLLFMGAEFGQWNEWDFNKGLDWYLMQHQSHIAMRKYFSDLNRMYIEEPALYEVDYDWQGFEWVDFSDSDNSVFSFIRKAGKGGDFLLFVLNLTPVPRLSYRLGVPRSGFYRELINSDADIYWGSNMGNSGGVTAERIEAHGRKHSLSLVLPPLSCLVLKPS
ncbi:MAG TPA: 1,4-alpha-glucan branching protein GlgB [Dissulfurispiraceae bacterium]|nr:1,4-alpha-glucan branching protein GlgB [Dissulfurispiraceae bacterium]